jgi:hypothetical protein
MHSWRILSFCLAFFVSSTCHAQQGFSSRVLQAAARMNCTSICGNPTCCIARSHSIAVCPIQGSTGIDEVNQLIKRGNVGTILNRCTRSSTNSKAIFDKDELGAINSLDCNWGCCSSGQVLASLRQSPEMAKLIFEGTKLASIGQDISSRREVSQELETKVQDSLRDDAICIFCCTF